MDREAWWATVHRVTSERHFKVHTHNYDFSKKTFRYMVIHPVVFFYSQLYMCVCVFVYIYTYIYIIKSECTLFTFSQDAFDYSKPVFLQKFFKNWQMKQHHTSL